MFERWGKPQRLRMDNGVPWGGRGDLPTDFALWLSGVDVEPVYNRPCCPQENGCVERSQGTGKRWGEPSTCKNPAELQERLDDFDRIQREVYPVRGVPGRLSRTQLWPALAHSNRKYKAHDKRGDSSFSMERVYAYLSLLVVVRRLATNGAISILGRNISVGLLGGREHVWVQFTADETEGVWWVISDEKGCELCRRPAREVEQSRVLAMTVTERRPERRADAQPDARTIVRQLPAR